LAIADEALRLPPTRQGVEVMSVRVIGCTLVVGPLLGLLIALPANAAPILNERYSGTEPLHRMRVPGA
jgi:hypothetical protein